MRNILQRTELKANRLCRLNGYDHNLEMKREAHFDVLRTTDDRETRQVSSRGMASLTALRSPVFVTALERAIGLHND